MKGIFSAVGDIIYQQGDHEHDQGPRSDGQNGVEKAEGVDFGAADNGNQGGGPAGRVQGSRQMHDGDGRGHGDSAGEPEVSPQQIIAKNAYKTGYNVTSQEVAGLGQGALHGPVDQHSGGAERPDNHDQLPFREEKLVQKSHQSDSQKGADPGPDHDPEGNLPRRGRSSLHFAEIGLD